MRSLIGIVSVCGFVAAGGFAHTAFANSAAPTVDSVAAFDKGSCSFNGKHMWGKIQEVTSFPDVKVQVVTAFPDVKVEKVTAFPDKCGKWQMVTAFPDTKVQFVTAFPDVKIQYVTAFPGTN